jgi:pyoverdine/dityrosine biosynthesis protein Dit1
VRDAFQARLFKSSWIVPRCCCDARSTHIVTTYMLVSERGSSCQRFEESSSIMMPDANTVSKLQICLRRLRQQASDNIVSITKKSNAPENVVESRFSHLIPVRRGEKEVRSDTDLRRRQKMALLVERALQLLFYECLLQMLHISSATLLQILQCGFR